MEKTISQRGLGVIILLIIALISIFGFSKIATSPEFHAETIQVLDDKKITVMELTTATAIASTAIAAIPSDATSPLANQIIELSEYLLIIIGVIFFEKILLTLTGYITFSFLIPIACLLYGIYLYVNKDFLRNIAVKLFAFGLAIFMIVPVSVKISELIENTYNASITQTIEDAKNIESVSKENVGEELEEEGAFNKFISGTKEFFSNVGDNISQLIQNCEQLLGKFIDAVAVLLITSCVIPIFVVLFFVWIIQAIWGLKIPVKNIQKVIIKKNKDVNK